MPRGGAAAASPGARSPAHAAAVDCPAAFCAGAAWRRRLLRLMKKAAVAVLMIILVGLLAALTLIVAILESRKPTEPDTPVAPLENPTVTPDVIKTVIDELFAMLENSLAGRPLLLF